MGPLVGAVRTKGPYKRAVTPTMYECFILIEINSKRSKVQKSGFLLPRGESRWGSDPSIVHVANAAPPTLHSNPRPCDEESSPSLSWAHRLTMHPLAGVYEIHLCPHKGKFSRYEQLRREELSRQRSFHPNSCPMGKLKQLYRTERA